MKYLNSLRPHQKKILDLFNHHRARYNVINGGVGTFKTSTCILGWLIHCRNHPGQIIYVIGESYEVNYDIWFKEFERLTQHVALDYKVVRASHGVSRLLIKQYDSEFIFKQFSRPTALEAANSFATGPTVSGYHLVQPDSLTSKYAKEFYSRLDQRVRLFSEKHNEPAHKRIFDTNAPYPGHWLHDYFWNEDAPDFQNRHPGLVVRLDIPTTPETSKYDAEQIEIFRRQSPPHVFQRFIEGFPALSEGLIYERYSVIPPIDPAQAIEYAIGIDPGEANHEWAIVLLARLNEMEWVVCDERTGKNQDITTVVEAMDSMLDYWGSEKANWCIYDWKSETWQQVFRKNSRHQHLIHSLPTGTGAVRAKWFPVEQGITKLKHDFISERLKVCDNCQVTIRDLNNYVWNPQTDKPDKKKYDPHRLDALRYVWIRVSR